jgi:light-regulated signal transduction histidine kinase (bacteriophytochrome)
MSNVAAIPANLNDCAREPIHIPGSIQLHGYLFVLDEPDLTLVAISENAAAVLGAPAAAPP